MNIPTCLAIDPGPESCGMVEIRGGLVVRSDKEATVDACATAILSSPDIPVLIEGLSNYGTAVGDSTLRTAYAIGKLASLAPKRTTVIRRTDIKAALLGTGTGSDSVIRQNVLERFGGPQSVKKGGPLKGVVGHAIQALAIACAWSVMRERGDVKAVRMP